MLNRIENSERRKSNEGRLDVSVRRYGLAFPLYHRLQLYQSLGWFRWETVKRALSRRKAEIIRSDQKPYPVVVYNRDAILQSTRQYVKEN
ncbi:hypothetical protein BBO01nite_42150 [Brevibacillus borstelensis]|jgi:hypothetical protein|nr:hypothetical protein BBO01nite_42150 [Brevibacillus borstelensis]